MLLKFDAVVACTPGFAVLSPGYACIEKLAQRDYAQ
jgi:hypothetical protein